jgi:hypothetical protein
VFLSNQVIINVKLHHKERQMVVDRRKHLHKEGSVRMSASYVRIAGRSVRIKASYVKIGRRYVRITASCVRIGRNPL